LNHGRKNDYVDHGYCTYIDVKSPEGRHVLVKPRTMEKKKKCFSGELTMQRKLEKKRVRASTVIPDAP